VGKIDQHSGHILYAHTRAMIIEWIRLILLGLGVKFNPKTQTQTQNPLHIFPHNLNLKKNLQSKKGKLVLL